MATTLRTISSRLKELHIEKLDGAEVILKGLDLLVEHADSPWIVLTECLCPPKTTLSILLNIIHTKLPDCTLDFCAAVVLQQAYLKTLQQTLIQEKGFLEARTDLDAFTITHEQVVTLAQLVEKLSTWKISAQQINFQNLHNEGLIRETFELLTSTWLKMRVFKQESEAHEATNFARRISYRLFPQILQIVTEHREEYAPLAKHLKNLGTWDLPEIESYKADLLGLPAQPVFHETFALRDIYIELQTTAITQPVQQVPYELSDIHIPLSSEKGTIAPLMPVALDQLEDREHVVCIQAMPGTGKSVFCQMLAARVVEEYPDWIPLLINLDDGRFSPKKPFEEAVKDYFQPYFELTEDLLRLRRVLFILDGVDELPLPPDSGRPLKDLFQQLSAFQTRCAEDTHWRHKILVTGRPLRIQDIESELPANFLRISIEGLEPPQIIAWLGNWGRLFGEPTAEAFENFLEHGDVFLETEEPSQNNLQELTRSPLALYLLGMLHRHNILSEEEALTLLSPVGIYDRLVSLMSGALEEYPANQQSFQTLAQQNITPAEFRQILREIAFCIWYTGKTYVSVEHIKNYLSSALPTPSKKLITSQIDGIYNLLIGFSFQAKQEKDENVQFFHKRFTEYLAAEKMVESLQQIGEALSAPVSQQPTLKEAAHRFYSVFGITLLTDETWDFVMNILIESFSPDELARLTERIYQLYIAYSDGRWMNEGVTQTQWGALKRYDIEINLLRVEAQVGINLFVLLCLLYWKTGGTFDICGREAEDTFDSSRFRKLLAIGELVGTFGLFRRIHHLLQNVNLFKANLLCANFRRVNLGNANLQGAILRDANLRGANLRGANLQGADLRVTNLQDADLREADLRRANLEDCDLRDASLQGALLQEANFLCTNLQDADLEGANLQKAVLYGATLQGANFERADLTGTIIPSQHLERDRHLFSEEQIAHMDVVHA